jgi:hypothetical protein
MPERPNRLELWLDLLIPVGAVLVICFALGSLYFDSTLLIASKNPQRTLKIDRLKPSTAVP